MNIHYVVFSLLVACSAGTSSLKSSNTSSCSGPDGCKQVAPAGSAQWARPSLVPALQAMPFAMPLLMIWDGIPTHRYHALVEKHFGHIDTVEGVRTRIIFAVVLLAVLCYVLAVAAFIVQASRKADDDSPRAKLLRHGLDETPRKWQEHPPLSQYDVETTSSMKSHADEDYVEMTLTELIQETGVSGMSLMDPWEHHGSVATGMPVCVTVGLIHIQGLILQGGLLYYMILQLQPQFALSEHIQRKGTLPAGLVFIALYIHFLNCAQDLPYSVQFIKHFGDFHRNAWDMLFLGPVLINDAIVVPILVVFIGSLYIATAPTSVDVLLNSVAVAFVKDIDNWIINLVSRARFFSGTLKDRVVRFPVNTSMSRILLGVSYFPVVPVTTTLILLWLALYVLKM